MTFIPNNCLTALDVEKNTINLDVFEYYGIAALSLDLLKKKVAETDKDRTPPYRLLSAATDRVFPFTAVHQGAPDIASIEYNFFYVTKIAAKKKAGQYLVTIRETLSKSIAVTANSQEEAEDAVQAAYDNEQIVLSADNFCGMDMSAKLVTDTDYPLCYEKLEDIIKED